MAEKDDEAPDELEDEDQGAPGDEERDDLEPGDDEEASDDEEEASDEEASEDYEDEDDEDEDDEPELGAAADDDLASPRRRRPAEGSDDDLDEGRAADVARSLGVGEDEEAEEAADEAARPVNRAERRRQRALQRRRQGEGAEAAGEETAADRNRRRRQKLLERRRRAAEAEDEPVLAQLTASEMMDDALARGTAAGVAWLQRNWRVLQWVLVAGAVSGVAFLVWRYQSTEELTEASTMLGEALEAEQGIVMKPEDDKRTDEEKKRYLVSVFPSEQARRDAAIAAYDQVEDQFAGSGPAILAHLGEAGVRLDRRDWDGALSSFQAVLDSELAAADVDVRVRALEGKGFALESKGDLAGALAAFTAIVDAGDPMHALLGRYHQARIHHAQKEDDKAKAILVELRSEIEKAKLKHLSAPVAPGMSPVHPHRWIEKAVTDLLTEIDPSAIPPTKPAGGALPPGKLQELLDQHGLQGLAPSPGNQGLPTP